MKRKIAVIVPEDMSRVTAYPVKVLASAKILMAYGEVTLYGYNLPAAPHDVGVRYIELSEIRPFGHSLVRSIPVYGRLVYHILRERYDYIYMPTVMNVCFPSLFLAARISRSRIIYNMHDSISLMVQDMPDELSRRASNPVVAQVIRAGCGMVERFILRASHYVITVSPTLVRYTNRLSGKSQERLSLVYNYVKASEDANFQGSREFMVLRQSKPCLFVLLGHLQPDIRGGELIFASMSNLDSAIYHLVVLGEIERREYWEAILDSHSIRDRVTFLDPVPKEQMLKYLKMTDAEVVGPHPSYALPNKLFDAYSVGLPVFVSDTMTDALEVLGPYAIRYQPTPEDLAATLAHWYETGSRVPSSEDHLIPTYQEGISQVFSNIFRLEPPGMV